MPAGDIRIPHFGQRNAEPVSTTSAPALAILAGLSLVFGVIAHLLFGKQTRWMWLIGTIGYFLGGLVASEVFFAWATAEELQHALSDQAPLAAIARWLRAHEGWLVVREAAGWRLSPQGEGFLAALD